MCFSGVCVFPCRHVSSLSIFDPQNESKKNMFLLIDFWVAFFWDS